MSSNRTSQGDLEEGRPLIRGKINKDENLAKREYSSPKSIEKNDEITLRIKLTDGREHTVQASVLDSIRELKEKITEEISAQGKFLRLIASGKMLSPDTETIKSLNLKDQSFVHCVLSSTMPSSISPEPTPPEPEEESDDPGTRRGFDRLRNDGMTRAEVVTLRAYFSEQVRNFEPPEPENLTEEEMNQRINESEWDRQMRAEEAWMTAQSMTSEFALNTAMRAQIGANRRNGFGLTQVWEPEDELDGPRIGSSRDFVLGFIMGGLLGFIMLFWLWESSVPQKQKFGIVTGVLVNLGLRYFGSLMSGTK
mmetsp:Transcript_19364/g.28643  ORF Transcript_19364/g.28643 Transcript_19364/m.28643 type:complete len:309 (+) Transcript_19364:75-1001(+)|eukprot:CAMPEP_0171456222 /NCGR_PEP_ID=MMETSP0945-20130129/2796_1 /TAXON_ID=109269 /ORGANISM="Vaucheria litorea, Strain CCMP2940" /LENGTH=308 /DNA_ID=CAMNT_0011981605 /DNA_START=69 /DNA_END=995 /DNA_ORIENTATION=-